MEEEEGKGGGSQRRAPGIQGERGVGVRAEAEGMKEGGAAVEFWMNTRLVDTVLSCSELGEGDTTHCC